MKPKNFDIKIRRAQKKDAAIILDLVKELSVYERLSHKVTATAEFFEKYGFGEHPYFKSLLVDYKNNGEKQTVGFALYFYTFSTFEGKPTLYLEDLFVKPDYRGKGIGKALLIELAKIAIENGCARMEWAVLDWNKPSIEFYKYIGAKPMSDWTVFRMEKEEIKKLAGTRPNFPGGDS